MIKLLYGFSLNFHMQITVSGTPGSGKSTVAKLVAKRLGYKYYSIGGLRREAAKKRGLSILEFNRLKEDTDKEFDDFQKKLGQKDNFVVDGRLSFHFIPKSVKFDFTCDIRVGAERIFKDQRGSEKRYESVEKASEGIKKRMENDKARYMARYGINPFDEKHYDYVIDTTKITVEQVVDEVMKKLEASK